MADGSRIEWTEATWNPLRGCSRVSAGCQHCYAERVAARFAGPGRPYEGLIHPSTHGWNGTVRLVPEVLTQPLRWKRPRRIFVNSMSDLFHESVPDAWIDQIFAIMALSPQHTFQILTKRPARMLGYFQSLEKAAASWRPKTATGQFNARDVLNFRHMHRHAGIATALPHTWPLSNVWLGVSIENQATADDRIPHLLQTPAAVRWLSCEPLLGPIDLTSVAWPDNISISKHGHRVDVLRGGYWVERGCGYTGPSAALGAPRGFFCNHSDMNTIDWVVAGGESGPGARPMHPDWARSLRDQCAEAKFGIPFFFKQWGEWWQYVNEDHYTHCGAERKPHAWVDRDNGDSGLCWLVDDDGGWSNYTGKPPMQDDGQVLPRIAVMGHYGKAAAGRLLDGVLHNTYPENARG